MKNFLCLFVVFFFPTTNNSINFLRNYLWEKASKKFGRITQIGGEGFLQSFTLLNGKVILWFNSTDDSTHTVSFNSFYWYGYLLFLHTMKLWRILINMINTIGDFKK